MKCKYLIIFYFIINLSVFAKIADTKPLIVNNVMYKSHGNYVEAIDLRSDKTLWKTKVFSRYKPKFVGISIFFIEMDATWNIISELEFKENKLVVTNMKDNKYFLDVSNGKIISKEITSHIILFPDEILLLIILFIILVLIVRKVIKKKMANTASNMV